MTPKRRPVKAAPLPRKASTGNASADDLAASVLDGVALTGFDGTTWDRLRTAPAAAATSGTGLLGVGMLMFDTPGGVYRRLTTANADSRSQDELPTIGPAAFNGTSWDRTRNNLDLTLLASAARTTTQTSADLVNHNGRALTVVLDMTVVGTGSVTVSIEMKDTASGKYIVLLAGAAIITNSVNRYRVGPDIAAVANSIAQDYLTRNFRIVVTANNANSATYSVGYHVHTA